MSKKLCILLVAALSVSACDNAATNESQDESQAPEKIGSLSLHLVGADSTGRRYRLREASFEITQYGPYDYPYSDAGTQFSTTVSSETDPDAPSISLRVVSGSYYVSLTSSAWYLERQLEGGWERVEKAVLLSPAQQWTYVYDNSVGGVAYRFGVDGELIDFRGGDLQIGIEIEQPGDRPDAGDGGFFPWQDAGVAIDSGTVSFQSAR